MALAQKACEGGEMHSCAGLGIRSHFGDPRDGLAPDDAKAVVLVEKACDGSIMAGCIWLGFAYQMAGEQRLML